MNKNLCKIQQRGNACAHMVEKTVEHRAHKGYWHVASKMPYKCCELSSNNVDLLAN